MKKRYTITVHGKQKTWGFPIKADPAHVEDWRADGFEVDEVLNMIPDWAVNLGLTYVWCWVQDVWEKRLRLW
jgi:hypothetical protein